MTRDEPDQHGRKNRACWDAISDSYQERHGAQLVAAGAAWGAWSIPESELGVLGEVSERLILELGCGAAQWSAALAESGAKVVGLDASHAQLEHAAERAAGRFPLVLADAEALPFADATFDVVFCDHGAMTFADPDRTVPEVARVLRPAGRFAFNMMSPLAHVCWSEEEERASTRLQRPLFGLHRLEDDDHVEFQRSPGEWIRLFRRSGLEVEALIELRPPENAETSYADYVQHDWARRWPAENIWQLTRTRTRSP